MKLEFINRVKENEVLGRSILSDNGQILLNAGVTLTKCYLDKLKELGVYYIYIEDDRLNDVEVEDEKLIKLKQAAMKSMTKIMKNVNLSNVNVMENNFDKVEKLVEYIIDMGDVNTSLYDIKTYDNYTYLHCLDTGIMSIFLGMAIGLTKTELNELAIGSILHDIGKIKIPLKIINKNGKLTDDEYDEIKKHPVYGKEMLVKNYWMTDNILKTVEQHHERVDGRGYPYGLKGKAISKFGKITAVCDVYDAVSNDRSYRKRFNPSDAYELILSGSGTAFDKDIIMKFKNTFSVYPLGCCVQLSNKLQGYVVRQNEGFPDKPVVRIFQKDRAENSSYYEIDLIEKLDTVIDKVI